VLVQHVINLVHRSILFSAVERYGSALFLLFSIAALSRLLTPEEFGIYAIINALTVVIAASFQEFGGANYLIQKPSLSHSDIRCAFTMTLCLSAVLAAILIVSRDIIAWFFTYEGMQAGIAVSSLNFFLSPFAITISALLRRDMAFGPLARCNLAGNFIAAVISIVLAALGYSFMAPIWGTIAGNAVVVSLLMAARPDLRIFRPSFAGYRDVVYFGAYSSSVALINVFYNFAPQLILGRILDFSAVGLYSRASSITQLFDKLVIQILSPVIMPAIVAYKRSGGSLKPMYLNAIELITAIQWPFLIWFAAMAQPIIWIWLGSTWNEIVPIIQIMCIASLALFAACLTYPILVAVGHVRDALVSSLISLPPSLLAIFVASFFGVRAVAASTLVTLPFQAFVAFYFVSRHLAISPMELVRATQRSGIVTVCSIAGVLVSMVIAELLSSGTVVELVLAGVLSAIGWWLGLTITNHPLLAQLRLVMISIAIAVRKASAVVERGGNIRADEKSL
jgi:O-antigen/teichoic acid export membrane protein